uniref:Aminotransferase-like plant mobile domain-containing protein n=1 Tax=Cucumis melo TaxID=3656 RepID=A0A9I9EBG7_CUCME
MVLGWGRMDLGPVDDSHLYLQATHRSQSIWDTSSTVVLSRRREAASQHTIPFDQRIAPYLDAAGFLGISQRPTHFTYLVESARSRCKILHAVGVASGWGASDMIIKFQELPPDAEIVSVQRYARAYIMQLIEGFLFADKSNTLVHCMFLQFIFNFDQVGTYAWVATTLVWLYRELCCASNAQSLEIAGPLMLLQVWAYNRFSIVAPQKPLQHSDGRPLSFRWSGALAASEQSANILRC